MFVIMDINNYAAAFTDVLEVSREVKLLQLACD
jgi:hypothetical protein